MSDKHTPPLDEWVEQAGLTDLRKEFACHLEHGYGCSPEDQDDARLFMITLRQWIEDGRLIIREDDHSE